MKRFAALVLLAACVGDDDDLPDETFAEDELALPDFHGRFGSPTIVRNGDTLHAYFPKQRHAGEDINITHARSRDDGKTWQRVGEALPRLNRRAKPDGSVWAPGAAKIADGRWMLYYTATEAGTERHMCTFRAHAKTANGPFVDDFDGPLACPETSLWVIDPYPVRDAQGDWHLLARVDEPNGVNTISIRALGEFGQHFKAGSEWVQLARITKGGWEEPVMENAALVRLDSKAGKRWYLFYSGGSYRDNSYGVGYADCGASIHGPCVKQTPNKPWLASDPDLHMFGPGTPTFYRSDDGDMMMAVNTWKFSGGQANPKNTGQSMHIFRVHIGPRGKPVAKFVRMID